MVREVTRIETVMAHVKARLAARAYLHGTRVPSVRAQARALGVSVSTVVEAYERLVAEGLLQSRPGSGFYAAGPVAPLALAALEPRREREVDPLWVSRQSLEAEVDALKPGCGWLPPAWMPEAGLRRALRVAARAPLDGLTDYASPLGVPALRSLLARRMAGAELQARPEQILLTESGTQAVDLVCRLLLEPGDTVLVDDPCYFNFHALLRAHRVRTVGVAYTPAGPDLEAFAAALQAHRPRLYITNSGIHNPTGATLAAPVAHRLLKLAEQYDLCIVEDDIFADFETVPAPRLAAFDGLGRVIHVGSFSKTLSASVRCGYIAARADWIDALVDLKLATSFGGGRLGADVVCSVLTDGGYRRHMEAVRERLAREMERVLGRLQRLGIEPWLRPRAGMFAWCRLPAGVQAEALARACLVQGVVLAPGNAFSPSRSADGFLRFNVAQCSDEKVFRVLARALDAGQGTSAAMGQPRMPATPDQCAIASSR